MKKTLITAFIAVAMAALSNNASATLTLDYTDLVGQPIFGSPAASNPTLQQIADACGITVQELGVALYKNTPGTPPTEDGPLKNNYTTVYTPPPAADATDGTVTISWDSGAYADATCLLVKDGVFGHYVFDLSDWDGKEDIVILNPYPGNGTISHIEFYGAAVPEPSTYVAGALLLLPVLAQLRRWKRAA